MGLLINLLTLVLVFDCVVLIFLVMMQLPKKDAGVGMAFGGGATDALFGAGSGNTLTHVTKWAAGIFLVLSMVLSIMTSNFAGGTKDRIQQELEKAAKAAPAATPTPKAGAPTPESVLPAVAPAATGATQPAGAVSTPPAGGNTTAVPPPPATAPSTPPSAPATPEKK